ncbi:unnamed protein product [Agarophyton chilense]
MSTFTTPIAMLLCCVLVAVVSAEYHQAPSPLRARQLAALSRRRSDLLTQLSTHQSHMHHAVSTRQTLQAAVSKFDKLLAATESACRSDQKACIHIDTVRAKLASLNTKLAEAHQLEATARDNEALRTVNRQLAHVDHRIASVKSLYYGYPSIAPRPRPYVTYVHGAPQVVIPKPQKPQFVFTKRH